MAGNSYLLDTVIVIAYLNRDLVVLHSDRITKNVQQIRGFVTRNTILPCDEVTGDNYGQIKMQLRAKGRPIPDNDIWIAATAMQHGLWLATRDKHFREIDGLSLAMW